MTLSGFRVMITVEANPCPYGFLPARRVLTVRVAATCAACGENRSVPSASSVVKSAS